ncbi:CpaD family pilus assembly protein [Sphingomonas daechungensis]|uniref:CpaD family pilus assembly protein n=1 Tax=Sphingomonas daechungensis TaxID=1176646 RepID=A0ABX6T0U5_9SPHN|nr:CpaD family pilus assembly lipoprotein [Sphingomonas daechungensis]QNP43310.1 CpaD family pilus assembly protein [Sphingomonas daechungensis]
MASKSALLLVAVALSGCAFKPGPEPRAGAEPVNVPVVSKSEFVFDAAAPNGALPRSEAERLDAWFRSLDLRYGDAVYVDGSYSEGARAQVASLAGNYGIIVSSGTPVTPGVVAPGTVRVVVSRTVASVPNCPNWDDKSNTNYNNKTMPNFGCAVNGNMAAMVANPEDLVHGREGSGLGDAATASRAINYYRTAPPSATKGLQETTTSKKGQ